MKLLLDTNIFLEVMLNQSRAVECQRLLSQTQTHEMHLTDFSLHSIGCHLFRRKKAADFKRFFNDIVAMGGIGIASVAERQYDRVADAAVQHALDFDDAYPYTAAQELGLALISFDTDFDRTDLVRKTPADILAIPTS
jgi:predicted nucleic acid-binding protein